MKLRPVAWIAALSLLALSTVALAAPRPAPWTDPDRSADDEAPAYDEAPNYDEMPGNDPRPAPAAPGRPRPAPAGAGALHAQTGTVTLGDGLARLYVPPGFAFLAPEEAERLAAEKGWTRPDAGVSLGIVVPSRGPEADAAWGIVLAYRAAGHVRDEGGSALDAAVLFERLRASATGAEIVGWAMPPRYDDVAKRLSWTTEAHAAEGIVLDYEVRLLARDGVLAMSAAVTPSGGAEVARAIRDVVVVQLDDGHRYADFDPRRDSVASEDLPALVAGDVAARPGPLDGVRRLLVAGTRLLAAGFAAAGLVAVAAMAIGAALLRRRGKAA
jgi:uncharacterized membrane-anchored protein